MASRRMLVQGDAGYAEMIAKLTAGAFVPQAMIDTYNTQAQNYNQQMADQEANLAQTVPDYAGATPQETQSFKGTNLDDYIQSGQLPPALVQYVRDDIAQKGIRNGMTEVNIPGIQEPLHVQVTNGGLGNINAQRIIDGKPYNINFSSQSGKLTEQAFAPNNQGGFFSDLGPLVLAGLAGNYLAGNFGAGGSLFGSGGAVAAPTIVGGTEAGIVNGLMGSALPAGATSASYGGLLGGGSVALTGGVAPEIIGGITASNIGAQIAAQGVTPSLLQQAATFLNVKPETLASFAPSAIQGLLSAGGSYLQSSQAKDAAQTQADAQVRAAQIAADAARFRPVGVTTRFGSSNFTTDAAGNVTGAGYTPSAEIKGYQNQLSTLANQGMTDIQGARAAYQPLTGAAQSLFNLGQGYLAKSPEQAAQDYITKQQALLAPTQENQLALLQNKLFQQGRGGAATAQGGNLMATSPELAAYYNSLAQSNLQLAANADQEARNRITYGAGLFDTGANLQGKYYTGQTAAYSPFTTAIDTSSGLERLAQQPLDLSTSIGQKVSTANANVGQLTGQGIINAANTMAPANAYSGTGNLLTGAASSPNVTGLLNNAFGVTPTQPSITQQQLIDILLGNKKSVFAT